MFRLLVISDMHCGNVSGLTPPEYWRADLQETQKPFWDFYTGAIDQIGPVDAVVCNGDAIDGPGRKGTTHHLTTDVGTQAEMAARVIEYPKTKRKFIVRGTGFHVDGDTAYEDYVAAQFGIDAQDELRLEAHGRKLHFRHVVGRSDTPYGQYTQAAKEMVNETLQAEFEDYQGADILGRAHVHYCVKISIADGATGRMREAFTNPCLELRGPKISGFVRGLRTWLYHVGFTLIEIDRTGEAFIRPIILPIKQYMPRGYQCLTAA